MVDQMLRRGGLAQEIFDQQAHAERARKGAQVLERGDGKLDGALRPRIVALAEMHHEIAQRNVLGRLERALDLVHGVDAAGFFRVQHIQAGRAGAAHLAVGIKRGVHGKGLKRVGAEPLGQLHHLLAAGVVEVLARGEDLHRLRAGALRELKQPRVQTVIQEQVSRQNAQHFLAAPRTGRVCTQNLVLPLFSHF